MDNLTHALLVGCGLVVVILVAFLFDWRTALISLTAIPLSLVSALLVLTWAGASINTMVLAGLVSAHPGLQAQLLTSDGDLNRFVNAFLNDVDIRHLEALDTPVADGDTLVLLPAMAGG